MFTTTQIQEIAKKLKLIGKKDTDLMPRLAVKDTDIITIASEGFNYQVAFSTIANTIKNKTLGNVKLEDLQDIYYFPMVISGSNNTQISKQYYDELSDAIVNNKLIVLNISKGLNVICGACNIDSQGIITLISAPYTSEPYKLTTYYIVIESDYTTTIEEYVVDDSDKTVYNIGIVSDNTVITANRYDSLENAINKGRVIKLNNNIAQEVNISNNIITIIMPITHNYVSNESYLIQDIYTLKKSTYTWSLSTESKKIGLTPFLLDLGDGNWYIENVASLFTAVAWNRPIYLHLYGEWYVVRGELTDSNSVVRMTALRIINQSSGITIKNNIIKANLDGSVTYTNGGSFTIAKGGDGLKFLNNKGTYTTPTSSIYTFELPTESTISASILDEITKSIQQNMPIYIPTYNIGFVSGQIHANNIITLRGVYVQDVDSNLDLRATTITINSSDMTFTLDTTSKSLESGGEGNLFLSDNGGYKDPNGVVIFKLDNDISTTEFSRLTQAIQNNKLIQPTPGIVTSSYKIDGDYVYVYGESISIEDTTLSKTYKRWIIMNTGQSYVETWIKTEDLV